MGDDLGTERAEELGEPVASPAQVVQKIFHPPCDGGSFLARRAINVPQSIEAYCRSHRIPKIKQALGAMDGHQPHGVEMLGGRRQLAQVAVVAEPHEPAHTIEQARDGQPASGRLYPHKVEELPDRDAPCAVGEILRRAQARGDACAIEQQRREHGPGRGRLIETIERSRELGNGLPPPVAQPGVRLAMPPPARRRVLGRPQMVEDRDHIGKGGGEVSPAGNAHQAHGAPIDQDREESQEILDLTPLEQTSQDEDRHAEPFQQRSPIA